MKCTQCDSEDLIKGVSVVDRGEDNAKRNLEVEVQLNPAALFSKEPVSAPVSATVCGTCGNVMFSVATQAVFDLRDAVSITKFNGNMKNHPRFKEFLREDTLSKHLNFKDQARHFAKWLRDNPSDS